MGVLVLTDDLMVASRISGAAQLAGIDVRTVADASAVVSRATADRIEMLFIDLSARAGDVANVIDQFRQAAVEHPRLVAFGPHVHEQLLTAATEAGCDEVYSRGQFFSQLDAIFARLADAPGGDHDEASGG